MKSYSQKHLFDGRHSPELNKNIMSLCGGSSKHSLEGKRTFTLK